MKKSGKCPKCGAGPVTKAMAVDSLGHSITVVTFRKPDAKIFKHASKSPLAAFLCPTCGFVEWYAAMEQ